MSLQAALFLVSSDPVNTSCFQPDEACFFAAVQAAQCLVRASCTDRKQMKPRNTSIRCRVRFANAYPACSSSSKKPIDIIVATTTSARGQGLRARGCEAPEPPRRSHSIHQIPKLNAFICFSQKDPRGASFHGATWVRLPLQHAAAWNGLGGPRGCGFRDLVDLFAVLEVWDFQV